MLACNSGGKSRIVRSRLLDERLSMAKRGLRGLYKTVIFDLTTVVAINSFIEYEQLNKIVKDTQTSATILPEEGTIEAELLRAGQSNMHKLNIEEFERQIECVLTKNEAICTAIKMLRKSGYRVAILGNNDVWAKSRSNSILEESQNLVDIEPSTPNAPKKTQAEVYEVILAQLKCQPASCIMVDKLLGNLKSAERVGITSIHVEDCEGVICQLEALLNVDLHLKVALQ